MRKIILKNGNSITINDAIEKFIIDCKVRNLSEYTIANYKIHFRTFGYSVDLARSIESVTKDDVDKFILEQFDKGVKSTSVNSYLRSIRVLLYWCMERKYLDRFSIPKIKEDREAKIPYTDDELMRLLKKPNIRKCSFTEYKTYVLISFLVATGQRLGATLSLTKEDIDVNNNCIMFKRTKKRGSHIIPIPTSLKPILVEYMEQLPKDVQYLFPNIYGKKSKQGNIHENIRCYNNARGVEKTSAHLFRHTFAKNWILNGYNQIELMRILDHSTLDMTNHYVNVYGTQVNMDKCDMLSKYINKRVNVKKR